MHTLIVRVTEDRKFCVLKKKLSTVINDFDFHQIVWFCEGRGGRVPKCLGKIYSQEVPW